MKLKADQLRMLKILGEGNPIGLAGIGQILAAQSLISAGLAEKWMMNTVVITEAGRRALTEHGGGASAPVNSGDNAP